MAVKFCVCWLKDNVLLKETPSTVNSRFLEFLESPTPICLFTMQFRGSKMKVSSIGALINSTGEPVTSDCQKADMFNKYFGSVGIIDNGVYTKCSNTEPTSVLETVIVGY